MRVVFRRDDGSYVDNEESFPPDTSADAMKIATALRLGGNTHDYLVLETAEPTPWLCHIVNQEIVTDPVKVAAMLDADTTAQVKSTRRATIKTKLDARTATLKELCEWIAPEL